MRKVSKTVCYSCVLLAIIHFNRGKKCQLTPKPNQTTQVRDKMLFDVFIQVCGHQKEGCGDEEEDHEKNYSEPSAQRKRDLCCVIAKKTSSGQKGCSEE